MGWIKLCYFIAVLSLFVLSGCSYPQPEYESKFTTVTVIGDSYANGLQALVAARLHHQNVPANVGLAAVGGSGYVNRGYRNAVFGDEVPKAVKPDDRLVVLFGSRNDAPMPLDDLASAARSTYERVQQIAPQARILVIGPSWVEGAPTNEGLGVRDVLRREAEAVGATFVDPISEGWFVGMPQLISPDGVHPNTAGYEYLADMITPLIAEQLSYQGG